MARPIKQGLEYFPFEVNMPYDRKVKFLRSRFGLKGYAIYTLLLCKIYQDKGYYCPWNDDEAMLFANEVGDGVGIALVNDVVHECFKRELFSEGIFNTFKILTSKGIQERYQHICTLIKRPVRIDEKYDCRSITELKRELSPEKFGLSPVETSEIPEETTQRKGKEIKEKESENPHAGYSQQFFSDSSSAQADRDAVGLRCRVLDIKPAWVKVFNAHLHTQGKVHKTYHEWMAHLGSWLPLKVKELQQADAAAPVKTRNKGIVY